LAAAAAAMSYKQEKLIVGDFGLITQIRSFHWWFLWLTVSNHFRELLRRLKETERNFLHNSRRIENTLGLIGKVTVRSPLHNY
jgi:hypothetical protein